MASKPHSIEEPGSIAKSGSIAKPGSIERKDRIVSREKISALGVVAPPPIQIETPSFAGSLATLFTCVRDHKVDLLDVPLFPICEAYFEYMLQSDLSDLDSAAAALTALAYLLERKAWLLLPSSTAEPEIEEALPEIEPTIEIFGEAIDALRRGLEERSHLYFRTADVGPDPYELPYSLSAVSVGDLAMAFERLLQRASPEPLEPLSKPKRSLKEHMRDVLASMGSEFHTLVDLVPQPFTRTEAVYWFMALLELIRLGMVLARLDSGEVEFALTNPILPGMEPWLTIVEDQP